MEAKTYQAAEQVPAGWTKYLVLNMAILLVSAIVTSVEEPLSLWGLCFHFFLGLLCSLSLGVSIFAPRVSNLTSSPQFQTA